MSKFKEIYNKIINENNSITNIEEDFINYDKLSDNYEVISEDTISIINEYVKDPELTPIPKEFLNIICSKVKFRRNNITIISMKELYELLREYEYPFYQEFKQNLKNIENGNLYIVMLFDRDFNIFPFNETYSFLLNTIHNSEITSILCNELLKDKHRYVDAFCSKLDSSINNNKFFQDNCLIYVSLKGEFIKDSLEHELTHFVQKIAGLNKTFNSIENNNAYNVFAKQDINKTNNLIQWIKTNIINDKEKINKLLKFFGVKFKTSELHQSIKAVLNGFQRMYEYGKFSYIPELDYTKNEINKEEGNNNIEFRLFWLNKFITIINSDNFIKNDLKIVINNVFEENEQQEYLIKYRSYFIILLYFGFKIMFDKLKIDEKLKEHFETFKYKDN